MSNKNLTVVKDENIGQYLEKFGKGLNNYAFRKYNHNSFIKSAMLAISENKDLRDCIKTQPGRLSLFHALKYAATTGLSLNPQEGKAALIPYSGKVQYQIMKNGMIEIAMESGKVEFITCDLVRDNDNFKIKKSVQGDEYEFIPALKDRGEIIGFFAGLKFKSGFTHMCWMTVEEVEEHRDQYAAFKGEKSAWFKSFPGMGIKTVLKRLLHSVYISDNMDKLIGTDDQFEGDTIELSKNGFSAEDVTEEIKKTDKKETIIVPDAKTEEITDTPTELF
jgi:phage RecT family recombinase